MTIFDRSSPTGQLTAVSRQMEKIVPARPQPRAFPVERYSNGLRILFIAFELIKLSNYVVQTVAYRRVTEP